MTFSTSTGRDERYEMNDVEEATRSVWQASEALERAILQLEAAEGYENERLVTKELRHDLQTLRMALTEIEKGNVALDGYDFEYDRMVELIKQTPGASLDPDIGPQEKDENENQGHA